MPPKPLLTGEIDSPGTSLLVVEIISSGARGYPERLTDEVTALAVAASLLAARWDMHVHCLLNTRERVNSDEIQPFGQRDKLDAIIDHAQPDYGRAMLISSQLSGASSHVPGLTLGQEINDALDEHWRSDRDGRDNAVRIVSDSPGPSLAETRMPVWVPTDRGRWKMALPSASSITEIQRSNHVARSTAASVREIVLTREAPFRAFAIGFSVQTLTIDSALADWPVSVYFDVLMFSVLSAADEFRPRLIKGETQ